MPLDPGNIAATSGMSKAIFEQMDAVLSPAFSKLPAEDLDKAREGWRKLSFAIAGGVVAHIVANMEIYGIEVTGNLQQIGTVTLSQSGATIGHVK
ncbi:MAG TPA: hypothetical protein VGV59_19430 [Pyrinomonadaceae bacterium]|nr:hypothetical protein [Pyrinomonadaceae bacterium]